MLAVQEARLALREAEETIAVRGYTWQGRFRNWHAAVVCCKLIVAFLWVTFTMLMVPPLQDDKVQALAHERARNEQRVAEKAIAVWACNWRGTCCSMHVPDVAVTLITWRWCHRCWRRTTSCRKRGLGRLLRLKRSVYSVKPGREQRCDVHPFAWHTSINTFTLRMYSGTHVDDVVRSMRRMRQNCRTVHKPLYRRE